ncbi:TetR/AcrR family transcriptional regulator [Nonomuraea aridisoli]|uniref:TetR/AcrR family transcriptional regulator n=1 Tax=Nonomuraea aridisoli TaxID=2070368 RepID=A0A2W2DEL9_9ACTN|nr:TetR/AcrR family transcriptional regulator [Nonomuraea aridisoli]PZG02359.1 TetR/AcrR family transcriptional regulator [Nonomuraea aridisoli]
MGLREQRKQRTQRALVETALRMFAERGYESATVAEIAAAAEVSPATFFNYFRSKEEVVFADRLIAGEVMARALEERRAGESPSEVVLRACDLALSSPWWSMDPADDLVLMRARLIVSVPALRARALLEVAELQARWSADLAEGFGGELDRVDADVLTGAVIGAILAVAGRALRESPLDEPLPELVRRAAAAALRRRP